MWVQLFGPAVIWFHTAASNYASKNPDVTITVLPVPYTSLQQNLAVDSGRHRSRYHVRLQRLVLLERRHGAVPQPQQVYGRRQDTGRYRVPVGTFRRRIASRPSLLRPRPGRHTRRQFDRQRDPFEKKGINYLNLATWDDVISAAKELTEFKGSTMIRSGLSPITGLANLAMLQSWVWQLGGEFYNTETGKWNFSTAEGKAAAQALYDLYWTDKVASFDLANINNETTQFQRGLVSSNLNGMWQISSIEETVPGFSADAIVTPFLTGYTAPVWDPDEISVITLSKALESDQTKLQHCVGLLEELTSASSTLSVFGSYSGATALKSVYASPDLAKERFGKVVARIGPTVWKLGRYNRDHVSKRCRPSRSSRSACRSKRP